ncbi:MAG: type IV toxin-antitoxin system AbiEi family antitoxin [Acidobacteriota bacterium]
MATRGTDIDTALAHLAALPFVRSLRFIPAPKSADRADDGVLELETATGKHRLSVEVKRSYLNRGLVNAVIGQTHGPEGKLVIARYVPAALGQQFVKAGVCFADDPGNIHLQLGTKFNWTVLGKREPPALPEAGRTTPATIQLLFQFAVEPPSAKWTVRDLARSTGISKTRVAQIRGQFLLERILTGPANKPDFRMTTEIGDRLIAGYSQILRPKLLIGRCRYEEPSVDQFVARLSREAAARKIPYALTGGPAADAMQHFYRGDEVPVFLDAKWQRSLRLLPDRTGPVMLFKPFGNLVYWREFEGKMVAPPWLVYAELVTDSDSRAREAAEEFRQEYLK